MKNKKINKWKIATILLGIIALGLIVYPYINKPKIVNIQGFEIPQKDIESLMSVVDYGQGIRVCSIETGQCVVLQKLLSQE